MVEAVDLTVMVEVPAPVIDVGLKLAETPEGKPLADRATMPLKPFKALVDTVYVVFPPGEMV